MIPALIPFPHDQLAGPAQLPLAGSETSLLVVPKPSFCSELPFLGVFPTFEPFGKGFLLVSKRFGIILKGFGKVSKGFGKVSKGFSDVSKCFGKAPKCFSDVSKRFGKVLKGFSDVSKCFGIILKGFSLIEKLGSEVNFVFSLLLKLTGRPPASLSFGRFRGKQKLIYGPECGLHSGQS